MEDENQEGSEPRWPHIRPLYHTMFLIYQFFRRRKESASKKAKIKGEKQEKVLDPFPIPNLSRPKAQTSYIKKKAGL